MRALLIVLTLLLAGCASSDPDVGSEDPLADPNDPSQKVPEKTAPAGGDEAEEETPPPGPGEGRERTFTCTVTLGNPILGGGLSTDTVDASYQACILYSAATVAVIVGVTPASGCSINAAKDAVLQDGDSVWARCDEVGIELENSIKVRTWN